MSNFNQVGAFTMKCFWPDCNELYTTTYGNFFCPRHREDKVHGKITEKDNENYEKFGGIVNRK